MNEILVIFIEITPKYLGFIDSLLNQEIIFKGKGKKFYVLIIKIKLYI